MTTPWILIKGFHVGDKMGAEWIEVDIADQFE
jgi:hypothetical protein